MSNTPADQGIRAAMSDDISTARVNLAKELLSTLEQQLEYLKHCSTEFGEVHDDEIESLTGLIKSYKLQLAKLS